MFKLMKYELRKQIFSKLIILIVLILLQIGFMIGLFTENERLLGTSIGLFIFLAVASVLYVSFESIMTFSNDLKTKQSYMLFLTPNTTYQIVGAKVLTTVVTILLTAAVFLAATLLDFAAVLVKYDELARSFELIQEFFGTLFKANIDYVYIISFVFCFVFELLGILVLGMASITLSATFLSNSKGKGIVSMLFFFGFYFLLDKISDLFIPARNLNSTQPFILDSIWALGIVVVFYFVTSYMLDKKVSV